MKKNLITVIMLSIFFAISTVGCQSNTASSSVPTENNLSSAEQADTLAVVEQAQSAEVFSENDHVVIASAYANGMIDITDMFSNRDVNQTPDLTNAQNMILTDNQVINITEAGIYTLSGTAQNCTIRIEVTKEEKVQLVLDSVNITNTDFPAIYIVSADKVFVTTTNTENTLSVSGGFKADGETNTDAVIFAKKDLVLNGTGILNLTSAVGNGIACKRDLKITGGTYTINAGKNAIEAKNSVSIYNGDFSLNANKDGIHCKNKEEAEGKIYIANGSFTINVASDGIQATSILQIDGGTFDITSGDGIEASAIQVNGGIFKINASDDGINAISNKNPAYPVTIECNGGDITILMADGDTDAVDSNGTIIINNGNLNITAPATSFDYETTAEFNNGSIIINGEQVTEIPPAPLSTDDANDADD